MSKIQFIDEKSARYLIEIEVAANMDKGFIMSPEGFANHCIQTGQIAHQVATKILEKRQEFSAFLNPEVLRVEGYMHDFAKIYEGNPLHEVGTAHIILTQGERLGLVTGASPRKRQEVLKQMARLAPSDYGLFEELGAVDFPNSTYHSEIIENFIERIEQLRTDLSRTGEPLSIANLALPLTLPQQVALYADLTNVNGQVVSVSERLADIKERYGSQGKFYNPSYVTLTDKVAPRALRAEKNIELLIN